MKQVARHMYTDEKQEFFFESIAQAKKHNPYYVDWEEMP